MKKKPKKKEMSREEFLKKFRETMERLQRRMPNSSLLVGPSRPCCWYHTPIC